jgi:hypothetical protein
MPFAQAKKKRFGVVHALLILILLGIIGYTAWYVYQAKLNTAKLDTNTFSNANFRHKKTTLSSTTGAQTHIATTTVAICPSLTGAGIKPPGWSSYSSSRYLYHISYPSAWAEVKNGGSVGTVPILDGLLFTPPGNQSPLYSMYVMKEGLSSAVSNWESSISDGSYNNAGQLTKTKESVQSVTYCTYQGYPSAEIVTKQNTGAIGVSYDIEFDISAHNYLYDFSTGFNWNGTTLSNSSTPSVGDVLSVVQSIHVY